MFKMKKYYTPEEMQKIDFSELTKEKLIDIVRDTNLSLDWLLEDGGLGFVQEHAQEYKKIENLLEYLKKYELKLSTSEKKSIELLRRIYDTLIIPKSIN